MEQPQFSNHHFGIRVPLAIVAALAVLALLFTVYSSRKNTKDDYVAEAKTLFQQLQSQGVAMEDGPCLGRIANDWVVDVAHNPRQPVDDKTENQCAEFRDGTARHFIELAPDGSFLRQQ